MPLIIILVECGIELIPKEIRNHPSVKKNLSNQLYSSQLLDTALHHSAMKNLVNSEKRGRPDITHLCLLNAFGSPLNKSGNLEIFLHTINEKIYRFNPEIRIARNYNRFKGLMAKLLIDDKIDMKKTPLITHVNENIANLIYTFNTENIYLLSSRGRLINSYEQLFPRNIKENTVAIIGGFQKGNISKEIMEISQHIISISQFPLDAWVATNKIITHYELTHQIQ
ncbi:MAG: 16S rRNA methyltransferase [Candidatus Thorarchaeota archaeon]